MKSLFDYKYEYASECVDKFYKVMAKCEGEMVECEKEDLGINCDDCPLNSQIALAMFQWGEENNDGLAQGEIVLPINPCHFLFTLETQVNAEYGQKLSRLQILEIAKKCNDFGGLLPEEDLGCDNCVLFKTIRLSLTTMGSDSVDAIDEGLIIFPISPCYLLRALAVALTIQIKGFKKCKV